MQLLCTEQGPCIWRKPTDRVKLHQTFDMSSALNTSPMRLCGLGYGYETCLDHAMAKPLCISRQAIGFVPSGSCRQLSQAHLRSTNESPAKAPVLLVKTR